MIHETSQNISQREIGFYRVIDCYCSDSDDSIYFWHQFAPKYHVKLLHLTRNHCYISISISNLWFVQRHSHDG